MLLLHLSVLQLSFCGRAATSPGRFNTFFPFSKRAISKRAISKRAPRATGVFLRWLPARVFLDVVVSWLHLTVMIAVSRAWAISTLSQRSWMSHVLKAGT